MPPFIFANTPFNRIPKIKKQPNTLKMMIYQILKKCLYYTCKSSIHPTNCYIEAFS